MERLKLSIAGHPQRRVFVAALCGVGIHGILLSLGQDAMGKEAYIEHVSTHWVDPSITVPLALAILAILALALGILWSTAPAVATGPAILPPVNHALDDEVEQIIRKQVKQMGEVLLAGDEAEAKVSDKQFLEADLREVKRMLEETPVSDILNRQSMEFRIEAIEDDLKRLEEADREHVVVP